MLLAAVWLPTVHLPIYGVTPSLLYDPSNAASSLFVHDCNVPTANTHTIDTIAIMARLYKRFTNLFILYIASTLVPIHIINVQRYKILHR